MIARVFSCTLIVAGVVSWPLGSCALMVSQKPTFLLLHAALILSWLPIVKAQVFEDCHTDFVTHAVCR